ncbi:early nodulin-like protein 1 [Juglans microcarpa x Juglans regia]|uniref:early nodulin-like protein 1 n=1 Tax=Juglans microcarpa x Juglans regia TaxID=2249226 RepID=UPI001B7E73C1|nr:early nodulin-like protein 1 [Juglans microcarpa x Juglans regia]
MLFSLTMADNIFPSNNKKRALHVAGLVCLMLLMQMGDATQFKVGGSKGWTVPTDPNEVHYNQWAEKNRFQIGDSLLFVYPPDQDSVLHVKEEDYINCNTEAPIEKFSDGNTVVKLSQSGPFYFVSGNKDHCLKNEKFVVIVLADRSNQTRTGSPAPAPAGEESPSPPAGTVEINPSPAPVSEPPPPSGASSISISSISSLGAFTASSLLLLFSA